MKWQKMGSAPTGTVVLVQAVRRISGEDKHTNTVMRWSTRWEVSTAICISGDWYHYPPRDDGLYGQTRVKPRRWCAIPTPPRVPRIDQQKMKLGKAEAAAQREHARRIAEGISDD